MAVYQFVYDNFNDNSIDLTKWQAAPGSSGTQTETSGRLNTPAAASSAPTIMRMNRNWYDLRKGRLAVRMTRSGTTNPDVYTYWGIRDQNNRHLTLFFRSNDANIQVALNDTGTGTSTFVDTTVGMGPSWAANTWAGWTYNATTKVYSLGKSTDGVNWTEIYKYTVTTSADFDPKMAGLVLGCTSYGTVTNFTPQWDDATYFATDTDLKVRVRYGGSWVLASPKVRIDGVWKRPISRFRYNGTWRRSN